MVKIIGDICFPVAVKENPDLCVSWTSVFPGWKKTVPVVGDRYIENSSFIIYNFYA